MSARTRFLATYGCPSIVFNAASRCLAAVALMGCASASAQVEVAPEQPAAPLAETTRLIGQEHGKIVQQGQQFQALGSDLFGDQTSYYTGTTEFVTTDVALPGNSGLPVAVTRRFVVQARGTGVTEDNAFADWELDIPWIEATFAQQSTPGVNGNPTVPSGWVLPANGGTYTDQRCSRPNGASSAPPNHTRGNRTYGALDYWHGYKLHMPGGGDQDILVNDLPNSFVPTTGETFRWSTREQWHITCGVQANPGSSESGEGFVALAPDGTRYTFNHFVRRSAEALRAPATPQQADQTLTRTRILAYPTLVRDRFGNEVRYSWSGSSLYQIQGVSNGGEVRTLTLSYETVGGRTRVASVYDGTRTWTYGYISSGFGGREFSGRPLLNRVTLPDSTSWKISFSGLFGKLIVYIEQSHQDFANCTSAGELAKALSASGSLTHPSGANGTFTFSPTRHGRSNVPFQAQNCYDTGLGLPPTVHYDDVAFAPYTFDVPSLTGKTVSGVAMATRTWNISYPGSENFAEGSCTSQSTCVKTTEVRGPDEVLDRYVYSNRARLDEGKLVRHERGSTSGVVLTSDSMTYALIPPPGSTYTHRLGSNPLKRGNTTADMDANNFPNEHIVPMTSRTTTTQGVSFTWTGAAFERSVNPTTITKSSVLGSRSQALTYLNSQSKWVLGLPLTLSTNGILESSTTYDAVLLLPISESSFGRLVRTGAWNSNGTLQTVTDARGNRARFQNYYRGIPQHITHAEGTTEQATQQAVVDNIGRISSTTDEVGSITSYQYDAIGRLSRIDYPTGDSTSWLPTTISYGPVSIPKYGIPAGHWQRIESTGAKRRITHYDSLFQPILEEQFDNGNPGGSRSLVRKDFDGTGQVIFTSYPVRSTASYTSLTTGVRSLFDPLDRPVSNSADSELGPLNSTIAYLSGFQRRTTNPRGNRITESFQAFDSPMMDSVVQRLEPLGVTVTIARDVWGKPTAITRSGTWSGGSQSLTRTLVYDANQRLCKRIDPESAATFFDYDAADNLAWSAAGHPSTTASCNRSSVGAVDKVVNAYDPRNRLTSTTIQDPLPSAIDGATFSFDSTYTYFPDGQLQTASAMGSTWTYTYNTRRLLESESLRMNLGADGTPVFLLDWAYDPHGNVASLIYPDGYYLDYLPDALGRPTKAGSLATAASYHPNGALAAFTYGNGIAHQTAQNLRQLPARSWDSFAGQTYVDYQLAYDANGNVSGLTDAASIAVAGSPLGAESRTLSYDARDRLIGSTPSSQSHHFGPETYAFDALDNLRGLQYPYYNIQFTYNHGAGERLSSVTDNFGNTIGSYTYDVRGNVRSRERIHDQRIDSRQFDQTAAVQYVHQFDRRSRLIGTYRNNGTEYTTYDAHGRRTSSDRNGLRNLQVYSRAGELLYEQDMRTSLGTAHPLSSNGKRVRHIRLGGSLVARDLLPLGGGVGTVAYAHTNPIRTATIETNGSRTVLSPRQQLNPWGATYGSGYEDRPGLTGHMTDSFSQLTYMQQRYYDPVAGRFLSVDPVDVNTGDGSNFNRYWYANNNPWKYTDPDGRESREFNWENAGTVPPARSADDWLGPAIGVALGGMLGLAVPDPTDAVVGLATLRFAAQLNASKNFANAMSYIERVALNAGKTGGRSGRRTTQYEGKGGGSGADRLFSTLTGGKSSPRDGGRLGRLGDGTPVQVSSRITPEGLKETSIRLTVERTGTRIREQVKIRFGEEIK